MSVTISKAEYEFLRSQKGGQTKIFGPKDDIDSMAYTMSNINKVVLDNKDVELDQDTNEGVVRGEEIEDVISTQNMVNNIMNDEILKQKTDVLQDGAGIYVLVDLQKLLNEIYLSNSLLVDELELYLIDENGGSNKEYLVDLFTKIELQFNLIDSLIRSYETFKKDISISSLNSDQIRSRFRSLDIQRKIIQNNLCRIVFLIKEQDKEVVNREIGEFLNNDFCPEAMAEIQKIEKGSWFSGIKETITEYIKDLKQGSKWIGQVWQSISGYKFSKALSLMWKNYTTLYIVGMIMYNITAFQSGGEFIELCVAIGSAVCKSALDPFIITQTAKWLTKSLSQTKYISQIHIKMYEYSSIVMGNTAAIIGPFLSKKFIKQIIKFLLLTSCEVKKFSKVQTNYRWSVANNLNASLQSGENIGEVLESWWTKTSGDVKDEIGKAFALVFGSYGNKMFNNLMEPIETVKNIFTGEPGISTQPGENFKFVWNQTSLDIDGVIIGGKTESMADITNILKSESSLADENQRVIFNSLWDSEGKCLLPEVIGNFISEKYSWAMDILSPCIDRFRKIYKMGYQYMKLYYWYSSYTKKFLKVGTDPEEAIINSLKNDITNLKVSPKYIEAKEKIDQIKSSQSILPDSILIEGRTKKRRR